MKMHIHNGMVAISDKEQYYQVYICPVNDSSDVLESALLNTKLIDWNRLVAVPCVNNGVLALLKRVAKVLSLTIDCSETTWQFYSCKESKPLDISTCPVNTYVGPLKPEFIDLVDRTWTFYTPELSKNFFETLMTNDQSYVLYSAEDNKPRAWIFVNEAGALTHLYCIGAYRRNGYAEYITKVAILDLFRRGKNVLAYTFDSNIKSQKLFHKLGLKLIDHVRWVHLTRNKLLCNI